MVSGQFSGGWAVILGGNFSGSNDPGENCPGGNYPGGQFSPGAIVPTPACQRSFTARNKKY